MAQAQTETRVSMRVQTRFGITATVKVSIRERGRSLSGHYRAEGIVIAVRVPPLHLTFCTFLAPCTQLLPRLKLLPRLRRRKIKVVSEYDGSALWAACSELEQTDTLIYLYMNKVFACDLEARVLLFLFSRLLCLRCTDGFKLFCLNTPHERITGLVLHYSRNLS